MSKQDAITYLRTILKPGDRIKCTVLHVSSSGMSRTIMLQVPRIDSEGRPYIADISWHVADAIGVRYDSKRGGLVRGGCGMNMCFAAVYGLGRALFPDGFGIEGVSAKGRKVRPRDAKHAAKLVKAGAKFCGRNGDASAWDNDGGYALDHRG